jgi:hypothetical protein
MWASCFHELRTLTNSAQVNLNPLELHGLHDHLHAVGHLLISNNAMGTLDGDCRPWPNARPDDEEMKEWCAAHAKSTAKRKATLRSCTSRADLPQHKEVLKEFLATFGEGTHESLERTSGDFFEVHTGKKRNELLTERGARAGLASGVSQQLGRMAFCSVVEGLARLHSNTKLPHLSSLAHARVNGICASPSTDSKKRKGKKQTMENGGAAMTAHPVIQEAVAELCCTRDASIGAVAKMRREQHKGDTKAAIAHANKHRAGALETKEDQAPSTGKKLNTRGEAILVETALELQDHLPELGVEAKKEMLPMQVNKRVNFLHRECPLEAMPGSYRTKKRPAGGKCWALKMSPSNGGNELEHLTKLIELMVAHEQERPFGSDNGGAPAVKKAQKLHTISADHAPVHLR